MAHDLVQSDPGEFLFYQTEDGHTRLQVRMEGETVWLSQKAMADLIQKDVRTIGEHSYDRAGRAFDPVRHNWLPLHPGARRFQEKEKRLLHDSRVVIGGRDPVADLSALVERRLIEATQRGQRHLPLDAAFGCGAHPVDVAQLLDGSVDLARISALARAFMAVRWDRWQSTRSEATPRGAWPDEAWMALRLACLPGRTAPPRARRPRRPW